VCKEPGLAQGTSGPSPRSDPGASTKRSAIVEELGTKDIEGVAVEGTRTTMTIAAGQLGNDQPLVLITERWLSPDLCIELKREVDDPQTGVTKTEYKNIQRGEPDPALFRIPGDYTVKENEQANVAH